MFTALEDVLSCQGPVALPLRRRALHKAPTNAGEAAAKMPAAVSYNCAIIGHAKRGGGRRPCNISDLCYIRRRASGQLRARRLRSMATTAANIVLPGACVCGVLFVCHRLLFFTRAPFSACVCPLFFTSRRVAAWPMHSFSPARRPAGRRRPQGYAPTLFGGR